MKHKKYENIDIERMHILREMHPDLNDDYSSSPTSNPHKLEPLHNVEDVGQAILALCEKYGLKYLFLTGGTDLAPIQDALVKFDLEASGKPGLIPVNVPHETVSTGMALGYAMFTGKPAAVAVHVHVGTANALGNIMNAMRSRVPLILLAGRTPYTESGQQASRDYWIHWGQDVYDPAGVLREFVKWEYEITRKENLSEVIARAFRVSRSDPPGPVYLTFGRELLMDKIETPLVSQPKLSLPVNSPTIDKEQVEDAAKLIFEAKNPLIICGSLGRNQKAVNELVLLCRQFGIAVSENVRTYMNYPTTDEMHVGFNTSGLVKASDLIVVLDCIVPWIPIRGKPRDSTIVVQVDQDPSFPEMPMWSFPIDIALKADSFSFLKQLRRILDRKFEIASPSEKFRIESRKARIVEKHKAWKLEAKKRAIDHAKDKPIDMEWLSYVLNQRLMAEKDFLLVNEYSMSQDQVEISKPGILFGQMASGYLGRGLGQALGLKLASPRSLVVSCVGDGSYIFGVPEAAHWVSEAYKLPFLTIIFNNQGWAAERDPIDRLYPKGWSVRNSKYIGVHIDPPGDYRRIVEAFDGYGERVDNPGEIESALDRAILQVRSKNRQAVLDVMCKKA